MQTNKLQYDLSYFTNDKNAVECLKNIIKSNKKIIVTGETVLDETSLLLRLLIQFTSDDPRIIAIENSEKLKLDELYPEKDIITWNLMNIYLKLTESTSIEVDGLNPRLSPLEQQTRIFNNVILSAYRLCPDVLVFYQLHGSEILKILDAMAHGIKVITAMPARRETNLVDKLTALSAMSSNRYLDQNLIKNDLFVFEIVNIHINKNHKIDEISELVKNNTDNKKVIYQNY